MAGPEGFYRIRVGDYRVIYTVEDDRLIVLVVRIAHRREVYR
jgi:mRNA interferase RelE/StbE